MQPAEIAGSTLFYRAPDGRIVFRPWGARGPCYLLTEAQRRVRSRVQLGYYAVMLVAIFFGISRLGTLWTFAVVLPVTLVGNYLLFWFFARGLPTTEPPPSPSPEHRQALIRHANRAFGRPLLWTMLALSVVMASVGMWAGWVMGAWSTAAGAGGFFALCAVVFAWQLRNQ